MTSVARSVSVWGRKKKLDGSCGNKLCKIVNFYLGLDAMKTISKISESSLR